ncbi:MAG: hypothetical protein ACRDIC_09575 [bacterium]
MVGKRITVDHLAAIVADGFQALHDEMREGFRHVNSRLDSVEVKLGEHSAVLAEHSTILAEHSTILDQHSGLLARIERKLDSTIARVDDHGIRLDRLERKKQS